MGLALRMVKSEMFSLSTIFLVVIPLLTNPAFRTSVSQTLSSPQAIVQSTPIQGFSSLLQDIGMSEASAVQSALPHFGGRAPVFIPGASY